MQSTEGVMKRVVMMEGDGGGEVPTGEGNRLDDKMGGNVRAAVSSEDEGWYKTESGQQRKRTDAEWTRYQSMSTQCTVR
jgi:hypothetical protein